MSNRTRRGRLKTVNPTTTLCLRALESIMYIVKINDKRASDTFFTSRKKAYKWLKKSVKKTGEKLIGDSTKGFIESRDMFIRNLEWGKLELYDIDLYKIERKVKKERNGGRRR